MTSSKHKNTHVRPFDFECYGVNIRIEGNIQSLVDEAARVARLALLNDIRLIETSDLDHLFTFNQDESGYLTLIESGELAAADTVPEYFFQYFNGLVRTAVAERAVDRLFIHAGAVGWNGKAILLPGTSFVGKSTLVAELVRNGAIYYSDDYAIFDLDGKMHPFPRTLSMREDNADHTRYELSPEELGGTVGTKPIPVGAILFTEYMPEAPWEPVILSEGSGVLEMIPFTFSFVNRPNFTLPVLNKIVNRATIISSQRGSAEIFAKTLLNFIDKHVN